jgi:hypothetical protein
MSRPWIALSALVAYGSFAIADEPKPKAGKEMAQAIEAINKSLGLESYPEPHCLKRSIDHQITPEEVKKCGEAALHDFSALGKDYVIAVLMAAVGPQTVIVIALDAPGWVTLSCDPGKPCPPRHAGTDKMGKRVVDRLDRACKNTTTVWFPEKKGCPAP